jgi:catechol 2,3-dioxygenase
MSTDRPYGVQPPAFRLPDGTRVGMVRLQVSDLTRAVEYYEHLLGLRVHTASADMAQLGSHSDEPPFLELRTRPGLTRARRGAFGLYHFAILLPDRAALGRFVTHLSAAGVRVGMADHFVSEALYLWDPDGLGIEVYADRPRSAWEHSDRELVMTTEELDVVDLAAAGEGQPWQGMPAGTTIGHVHLHVGSLAEAEAFYHRKLGLDKMVWSYPGALFLAAGGYHHHLGTNVWSPGPSADDNDARLLEWELLLPGEEDVLAALASLNSDSAVIADPWGTRLRLLKG